MFKDLNLNINYNKNMANMNNVDNLNGFNDTSTTLIKK